MPTFKFFSTRYLLILICVFFLFTRFYKIAEIPVSVYWDEASIGYNAYSILETGKDEWGKLFPLHLRAFGEFKLPVYIYATVLSVKLFGLSEFSVRVPAVFFSLGVVILTYLLSKRLSGSIEAGLAASFLISISPWFFIFSRTGYEATAGLMFYLLGIYLFLMVNINSWYFVFVALSFILSSYSYNSFRIIVPVTILILFFYRVRNLKESLKPGVIPIIFSVILLVLSVIPIYRLFVYDTGSARLQAVSATPSSFVKNYLSHFSPNFLFFHGDKNLRSQQADFGQLYLPELILLPLGIYYVIRKKSGNKLLYLILFLLGPVPAAITRESPHALRAISMIPFIAMISAEGAIFLYRWSKKIIVIFMLLIIFLIFFANYFLNFLNIYPRQSSKDWQYAYKEIFTDYKGKYDQYNQVLISDEYAQPYIFALFYQKTDPNQFRQTVIRNNIDNWGFSAVSSFDKFIFGKINDLVEKYPGRSIIFASNNEIIPGFIPVSSTKFLDGEEAFWIYQRD